MPSLAPPEILQQIRQPKVIFTDQFLNDPIQFAPDPRFIPQTVLAELDVIEIADRDAASFITIELNTALSSSVDTYYPATTFSPLYNRGDVFRIIDVSIIELLPSG